MEESAKTLWKSKTFWFNVSVIGSTVFSYVADSISQDQAMGGIIVGIVGIILRLGTKGAIGKKP